MSTGVFTFAHAFATAMTSDEARATTDDDRFRQESWDKSLASVTDAKLAEILWETGPFKFRTEFKGLLNRVLSHSDASDDLPHILIALALLYGGYNPSFMRGWMEQCES